VTSSLCGGEDNEIVGRGNGLLPKSKKLKVINYENYNYYWTNQNP
jgi:hypothetical protein